MDFLKTILGDDLFAQVQEKLNAHNGDEANKDKQIKLANLGEGGYVSKDKFAALETDKNGIQAQLTEANTLIETLKKNAKSDEAAQQKFTEYETKVADLTAQLNQERLDNAVALAIRDAKGIDADYLAWKLKEKGDLELGEDGKIKGIDDKIAELKTQLPQQFEGFAGGKKVEPQPLPGNNTQNPGLSKEQFDRMGYQSRLKLKQEQPDV